MTLKEWRIEMQKCLLEVEKVEHLPLARTALLPVPLVLKIQNLARDLDHIGQN